MTLQLPISYEMLVELVNQLPIEKQQDLLIYLAEQAQFRTLSNEEKKALYHASILDTPVNEAPSIRRVDWYDDDGR